MQYKFSLPQGIEEERLDDVPIRLGFRVRCTVLPDTPELDEDGNEIALNVAEREYVVDGDDVPNWPLTPEKQKALVKKYMKAPGNNDQIASAEASHAAWVANEPVIPAPVRRIDALKEAAAPAGEPPAQPIKTVNIVEFDGVLE